MILHLYMLSVTTH